MILWYCSSLWCHNKPLFCVCVCVCITSFISSPFWKLGLLSRRRLLSWCPLICKYRNCSLRGASWNTAGMSRPTLFCETGSDKASARVGARSTCSTTPCDPTTAEPAGKNRRGQNHGFKIRHVRWYVRCHPGYKLWGRTGMDWDQTSAGKLDG